MGRSKIAAGGWPARSPFTNHGPAAQVSLVVSIDERNRQWLSDGSSQAAAAAGQAVHQTAIDADHERAEKEEDAAETEGDIKRHDFIPRWWRVIGAMSREGNLPAITGAP